MQMRTPRRQDAKKSNSDLFSWRLGVLAFAFLLAAAPEDDTKYTADITKRANDIIALLNINDAAKTDAVRDVIVSQYRSLRAIDEAREAKVKEISDKDEIAKAKADSLEARKKLHEEYLAKLAAAGLTPEQIETVKDKMVYGKVKVTYDAYQQIYGPLTDEQNAKVLSWLKEARELAMDGGSSSEKDAIFNKYKGKINNWLSSQGIDMKAREKAWSQKRKTPNENTTTQQAKQETP
jgi:hypothetical protein